jgi:hypothetical protein
MVLTLVADDMCTEIEGGEGAFVQVKFITKCFETLKGPL